MNICILQHVPFEGSGTILPYFQNRHHQVQMIHLYEAHNLPKADELENLDLLIIMGGPMSVHDTEEYPYLLGVKSMIADVIAADKWVLGICLGAQLVAESLGAKVQPNPQKEIGWYPVQQTQAATQSWLADLLPCEFTCLHWHGETFDIPDGAVHVARSQVCESQAFVWNTKVIGLQYHLEFTPESTMALIERSEDELAEDGEWIQTKQEMLVDRPRFDTANNIMAGLLHHIESEVDFVLHPQLAKDCHIVAEFNSSRVLLNKNAEIPWFILVPRGEYRDLDDLPRFRRHRLLDESDQIAELLRDRFDAKKINIGALGNMVPQLHLHVIGRRKDDPCWPNSVWGNLQTSSEWSAEQLEEIRSLLA